MKDLNNKVAVVTGAGSGIGRALAIRLAREGCHLALADLNSAGLDETIKLIQSPQTKITSYIVDVSDREAVHQFSDSVIQDHQHVDLVINNAGVSVNRSIEKLDYEDFEWVLNINMWGMVYGSKAFLPHLKTRPEAHIVNMSSATAMLGFPLNGPYNMSKSAIQSFTETLIQEFLGTKLRFTSVHPGGIKTNIANSAKHMTEKNASKFNKLAATTPERAAKIIINGIKKNKEKILVGPDAYIMTILKRLLPNWSVRLCGQFTEKALWSE